MLNPVGPLRPRVLVVDDELAKPDTALGRAVESLAAALEARNIDVLRALSFEDGQAIVVFRCLATCRVARLEPWH